MRMIQKTIYNFNELDDDIKEKLIQRLKDDYKDDYLCYYLEEDIKIIANEILQDNLSKDIDVYNVIYNLDYSQGSGAVMEFNISIQDINKVYNALTEEEYQIISKYDDTIKIRYHKNPGSYTHEFMFDFDYDDYTYIDDEFTDSMQIKLDSMMNVFKDLIIDMNRTLTKKSYALIENYQCDDDFILQVLQESEYYEDGAVYIG